MSGVLNFLVVEDSQADFLLIERHIKQGGLLAHCTRVENLEELKHAMETGTWDVVLSDYSIPRLDFTEVYTLIRARLADVPIILVSGSIGEEKAVELLKRGICDFVLKDRLARLAPAIQRSLEEAAGHRARCAAEEARRASEERLNLALTASRMGVWEWDIRTNTFFWSPQCYEILGQEDFSGTLESFLNLVHPQDVAHLMAVTRQALEEGTGYAVKFRINGPHGEVRWVSHLARAEYDAKGKPLRLVGTLSDITERKRAEEALHQSEQRFRLIAETIDQVFWMADHKTDQILYISPGYEHVWQRSRNKLYENPGSFLDAVHTDDAQRVLEGFTVRNTGQPFQLEYRIVRPDGSMRWIRDRGYPVHGLGNQATQYAGVAEDITERKEVQDALKQSEAMMRLIIESSPIGMRIAQHGAHVYANPALIRMFGYTNNAEMTGLPVEAFYIAAHRERIHQALADLQAGKSLSPLYEVTGQTKDGKPFDVIVRMTPIDYQGKPASLSFITDVSAEKTLRTQLFQAQKMEAVGTLAGGIAHDFNNILGIILGNAEMVLFDTPKESPRYANMQRITHAAFRARDLVQQILTFSRQSEHERIPLSLAPIIKEALKLLRSTLPATIEIRQEICVPFVEDSVLADPTQIHQILMNLCTNAARAMRETGGILEIKYVTVDFRSRDLAELPDCNTGSYVVLTVSDTGHGMSQDVMEHIFEPYFTTRKREGGTGLGLAVVHGIVKEHGGVITVTSVQGKGSTFHVYFPIWHGNIAKSDLEIDTPLQKGTESVLLVDDEVLLLEAVCSMLQRLGYRVVAKTSGPEALEAFRARPNAFDLVITDQTMPKMTGIELSKQLMAIRPELPVILCTGFSDGLTPEKSRAADIRALAMKPIVISHMARTIRMVLNGEERAP